MMRLYNDQGILLWPTYETFTQNIEFQEYQYIGTSNSLNSYYLLILNLPIVLNN